uniref:Reverse transcriptase n=1 Tax=Cannabis sativa TaxID=3483 RepID=A0A803QK79_CANSA
MYSDKSPYPESFNPGFYQKFWDIVGSDVVKLVQQFFMFGEFSNNLYDTHIVLIPKKSKPESMNDFRPIALCNVIYKIVSKVLANQFKGVLHHVILESQSAFIPGRLIMDNILISFEIMHYLKRKSSGKEGVMAIKLDMSKTDASGHALEAISCCKPGTVTPEIAEAMGVREALSWLKKKGWNRVTIETDYLTVVQAIRSPLPMFSYFGSVISDCKTLLKDVNDMSILHVKRSANSVAHTITRVSSCAVNRVIRSNEFTPDIRDIIVKEVY